MHRKGMIDARKRNVMIVLNSSSVHGGSFKLDLGAIGLTEIIRAGGASNNLQSRAKEEMNRVCSSSKAEKIGGLIKSTNT